jgi:hypothetical protein
MQASRQAAAAAAAGKSTDFSRKLPFDGEQIANFPRCAALSSSTLSPNPRAKPAPQQPLSILGNHHYLPNIPKHPQ